MHLSLQTPSPPPAADPEQPLLEKPLLEKNRAWLREELEGARLLEQRAAIRQELGVLEELAGHDSLAVRELLAAVNALPRFKEPLERLINLIERHRSFKHLPTLLEHLCGSADTSEELARAQLALAWCYERHLGDDARALAALDVALRAAPQDPAVLLSLEVFARRRGDTERLRRALRGRIDVTEDAALAHCLRLDLAELLEAAGDSESAHAELERASADPGPVGYVALERRVALGRATERIDWLLPALELQTERAIASLSDAPGAATAANAGNGSARAVFGLLELARLAAALGHEQSAITHLERALALEPSDPVVAYSLLLCAGRAGRHDIAERIAQAELAALPVGAERASLGVLLAESRLAQNQPAAALAALEAALEADPTCWVARAFQLDLLRGTRAVQGYAGALEQVAEHLVETRSSRRYHLLAAFEFCRHAEDTKAARHALRTAEAHGALPAMCERVARILASVSCDAEWYGDATRRLLDHETDTAERTGLALELWRAALLGGDTDERKRLEGLLEAWPEGRTLARLARAYAAVADDQASFDAEALLRLAEQSPDPNGAAALAWTAALGLAYQGAEPEARALLSRQHATSTACAPLAGTLVVLLDRAPDPEAPVASVLRATAAASDDAALATSLFIEAGLRTFGSGQRASAAADFTAADGRLPGAGVALSFWAKRAADGSLAAPDEAAPEALERVLSVLESLPRESQRGPARLRALEAELRGLERSNAPLAIAARLLVLLLARCLGEPCDPEILAALGNQSPEGRRIVDAFRYLECLAQPTPEANELEEATRLWSDSSASLASALEWLGAAQRLGHVARECAARYRVSQFLSGSAAELAAASAALVEHFLGGSPAAFLEGTTPQLRLTNLETSPAGCDLRRRARALGEAEALLGTEEEPMLGLLRAYNLLGLGENASAVIALRPYTQAYPEDPAGWEALATAARQMPDPELLAEATLSLAECSREPAAAARLFEEAAALYLDGLGDVTRGEAALRRAASVDVSRTSSFGRLSKLLRERGDAAGLLELCERRLQTAVPSAERIDLEWQRARAHRQLGDAPAALAALDRVVALDTRHIRALALFGEIYITQQRHREAAEVLARLAEIEEASGEERLTSGLCAVDLYENQLQSTERALEVLLAMERAGLGGLAVRERLARAAAKSESWDDAVAVLEQLMFERSTTEERAEAARLALAIHRDRRDDPTSTARAARALLELEPCDAEALDVLLGTSLATKSSEEVLDVARIALAESLERDPFQLDALKRLARVADRTGSASVRQVAVGALLALGYGGPSSGARAELAALDQQLCSRPSSALGADLLGELRDPNDHGPVADLLALVASHLGRALGPELSLYKVSRRERILPGSGAPVREEVEAWARAFGLGELELYASGVAHGHVVAFATEPTSVVLGFGVVAPLGPFQRQELARVLYAQSRGLGVLTELEESDVPGLVAALCQLGGVTLDAPHYARQADYERHLGRVLPRKIRKALPATAEAVRAGGVDIAGWTGAARRSLDRAAALAVGDLSVVLSPAPPSDREAPTPAPPTERTRRLASFMLAPAFDALRQRCGVIRT